MPESPEPPAPARHFIAINHHRFHDAALVERTVASVLKGAARLRAERPGDGVRVTLFFQREGLPESLLSRFEGLCGLELVRQPASSNGAALNAQIDMAAAQGAAVFYRVDADDPVLSARFVRQLRLMARTGAPVIGGGLTYANQQTGARTQVIPPRCPGPRDFLENSAMLHPTLCFDVAAWTTAGIRYWSSRLEDKHVLLQVSKAGLEMRNVPESLGTYSLNPQSRRGPATAWRNLLLNLDCLRHTRRLDLLPLSLGLFVASTLLPSQWLRALRFRLRARREAARAAPLTPCSEFGGGNGAGRKAL